MEYHVLIAWNKANIKEITIENSLRGTSLSIIKRFIYTWDEKRAKENYAAFYGEKLEDIQYKVDHCGKGKFLVYILVDDEPHYEERETSSGIRRVNSNLFDLKTSLRSLTGGGHLIHASDTNLEANLNCMSLFGMLTDEVIEHYSGYSDNQIISINRNVTGVNGWDNWEQLLCTIDKLTPYVILRNIETITSDDHEIHGDTDLLVGDFQTAVTISAARKEALGKDRVLYSVLINNVKQLVDFRHLGDGYYCELWEKNMLSNRNRVNDTVFWTLNDEDYSFSLLYHALVHKPYISDDYQIILKKYFGTTDRDVLIQKLKGFIEEKEYTFSKPVDSSVYIHPDFYSDISIPMACRLVNQLKVIKYKRGGYERESIRNPKISKVLYQGYYMGITILRKTKAGIKKILHHKS